MLCAMWCIGSIIPLNKHKIDALNHHRFVSSEAYQKLSYPAVAFIKGSTYYVSLIVPYLPKTHQVMFIESCEDLSLNKTSKGFSLSKIDKFSIIFS